MTYDWFNVIFVKSVIYAPVTSGVFLVYFMFLFGYELMSLNQVCDCLEVPSLKLQNMRFWGNVSYLFIYLLFYFFKFIYLFIYSFTYLFIYYFVYCQ